MVAIAAVEIEYEMNLGYIARIMKNFDINELLLIKPNCDINKAKIYATHGIDILNNAKIVDLKFLKKFDQIIGTTAIRALSRNNIIRDAVSLEEVKVTDNSCILVGRESTGLTNEELSMCDIVITIDAGRYNTLNISHALAIILYELNKKRYVRDVANNEEIRLLIDYALLLARISGINEHRIKRIEYSLKRILGRALPTSKEVRSLIILLRKAILSIERTNNNSTI